MSNISRADAIVSELLARLTTIRKSAGFNTDTGRCVFDGKLQISEADAITLVELEEDASAPRGNPYTVQAVMHLVVEAVVSCNPDHPNKAGRAAIADIFRALFSGDTTLSGLLSGQLTYTGRVIQPRLDGQNLVSVQIKLDAVYPLTPQTP
jgi:hypothetical protein